MDLLISDVTILAIFEVPYKSSCQKQIVSPGDTIGCQSDHYWNNTCLI